MHSIAFTPLLMILLLGAKHARNHGPEHYELIASSISLGTGIAAAFTFRPDDVLPEVLATAQKTSETINKKSKRGIIPKEFFSLDYKQLKNVFYKRCKPLTLPVTSRISFGLLMAILTHQVVSSMR